MPITRREAIASLAVLIECLASGRLANAQSAGDQTRGESGAHTVFVHDLPNLTMNDWQVTVSEVDFPPRHVGAVHHHAGFVLAYVLEGAIISKVSGQGPEKTYTVGEMFYEQPGATHEVSRNASQSKPARLLAMILAPKGAQLTTPGPAKPGFEHERLPPL